ncbi:MAG: zinc ribbon domain-containing protein, partial [Candidatus Heimdallarchaeota archaeon]|nr:zinc ribbon domain-containing protein [Candidatus Heimdallarchaeota archaeon]
EPETSATIDQKSSPQEPETSATIDQKSGIQSDGTYKPSSPGWLARPQAAKEEEIRESPEAKQDSPSSKDQKAGIKLKNISCPKCSEDVPLLQYCKFCGQNLLRNCPTCNKEITTTAKFCTGCGTKIEPLLEKKQSDE